MSQTKFSSIDEMLAVVPGTHLGFSGWRQVTQHQVDLFADATSDHQWIHVDPERASTGPFGGTIAHGYLTLALAVPFVDEIFSVEGVAMGLNYGTNKVRFPAPVPVGSRVRAGASVASAEPVDGGGQITLDLVFEVDGGSKPVCVAQVIYRFYRG